MFRYWKYNEVQIGGSVEQVTHNRFMQLVEDAREYFGSETVDVNRLFESLLNLGMNEYYATIHNKMKPVASVGVQSKTASGTTGLTANPETANSDNLNR